MQRFRQQIRPNHGQCEPRPATVSRRLCPPSLRSLFFIRFSSLACVRAHPSFQRRLANPPLGNGRGSLWGFFPTGPPIVATLKAGTRTNQPTLGPIVPRCASSYFFIAFCRMGHSKHRAIGPQTTFSFLFSRLNGAPSITTQERGTHSNQFISKTAVCVFYHLLFLVICRPPLSKRGQGGAHAGRPAPLYANARPRSIILTSFFIYFSSFFQPAPRSLQHEKAKPGRSGQRPTRLFCVAFLSISFIAIRQPGHSEHRSISTRTAFPFRFFHPNGTPRIAIQKRGTHSNQFMNQPFTLYFYPLSFLFIRQPDLGRRGRVERMRVALVLAVFALTFDFAQPPQLLFFYLLLFAQAPRRLWRYEKRGLGKTANVRPDCFALCFFPLRLLSFINRASAGAFERSTVSRPAPFLRHTFVSFRLLSFLGHTRSTSQPLRGKSSNGSIPDPQQRANDIAFPPCGYHMPLAVPFFPSPFSPTPGSQSNTGARFAHGELNAARHSASFTFSHIAPSDTLAQKGARRQGIFEPINY